jgi:hypothetical protein
MGDDGQIVKYIYTFSFCLKDNTLCFYYKDKPGTLFSHSIAKYCENYLKHNLHSEGTLQSVSNVTAVWHLLFCVYEAHSLVQVRK